MAAPDRWTLAVDLGTSRCVGANNVEGVVSLVEVDGARWTPSAIGIDSSGQLVVGARADDLARTDPDRCERTPKRHVGSVAPLLVAGTTLEIHRAFAAVLTRFRDESTLRNGAGGPIVTVLTHPVRWSDERTRVLLAAADEAGLPEPTLLPEPVAAAIHYADEKVETGAHVAVFDLGGGTFDAAVLRRTDDGFDPLGVPGGVDDLGGEVFDHLVFNYFGEVLQAESPELWEQLSTSDERGVRKAAADLVDEARKAKEALSSYTSTQVFVPQLDRDVVVTRTRFEQLIRPDIERAVTELDRTVGSAGLKPDDISAVYLVGGSSRIPMVGRLLAERYGDRVLSRDEPKSVVALGAAKSSRLMFGRDGTAGATPAGTGGSTGGAPSASDPPPRWTADLGGVPAEPLVDGTNLLVPVAVGASGQLYALAADSGKVLWRTALTESPGVAPASDGSVAAVVGPKGSVSLLDVNNGASYWVTRLDVACWARPAIHGSNLFVGTDGSELVCLDRGSGRVRWRLPVGSAIRGRLIVVDPLVVACNVDGRIFGVEMATGRPRWARRVGARVIADAAQFGDSVVVPTEGGEVVALDVWTGNEQWRSVLDGPVTRPLCADATSIMAVVARTLTALGGRDGQRTWSVTLSADAKGGVTRSKGLAVVATATGTDVIDPVGHRVTATLPPGAEAFGRPVVTRSGDLLRVTGNSLAAIPLGD